MKWFDTIMNTLDKLFNPMRVGFSEAWDKTVDIWVKHVHYPTIDAVRKVFKGG